MKRAKIGAMAAGLMVCLAGVGAAQDNAERPRPRGDAAGKGLDKIFTRLDKNGDGVLTKDELFNPARFDALDADKDGKVTQEEFQKGAAGAMREAVGTRFMKQLDTNGDGKVSKAEFEALFARLDKDGDGQLSQEELSAAFHGGEGKREGGKGDKEKGRKGRGENKE